jgi:anti-anti-sigma factor
MIAALEVSAVSQLVVYVLPARPPVPAVAGVCGDVDRCSAPEFLDRLDGEFRDGLVLDVSGVDFLDVAGLRALMALDTRLRRTGHPLVLAAAPRAVQMLLDVVEVDEPVSTAPTVEGAIARFAMGPFPTSA